MTLSGSHSLNFIFDTHQLIDNTGLLPVYEYLPFAAGIFHGTVSPEVPLSGLPLLLQSDSFSGDLTRYFKDKWLSQKLFVNNNSKFFKIDYQKQRYSFCERSAMWTIIPGILLTLICNLVLLKGSASKFNFDKFLASVFSRAVKLICNPV